MKKALAYAVAAVFGLGCAYAGAAEVTQAEEVRIDPEVKRNAQVAKKKTKRAAKKAKAKTKAAAKRTRAAAKRAAARTEAATERASARTRAAADRTEVRIDTKVDSNRGDAVLERNR